MLKVQRQTPKTNRDLNPPFLGAFRETGCAPYGKWMHLAQTAFGKFAFVCSIVEWFYDILVKEKETTRRYSVLIIIIARINYKISGAT